MAWWGSTPWAIPWWGSTHNWAGGPGHDYGGGLHFIMEKLTNLSDWLSLCLSVLLMVVSLISLGNLDFDLLPTMLAELYLLIMGNFPTLLCVLVRINIIKAIKTYLYPKIHGYVTAAVNWLGARVKSFFSKNIKAIRTYLYPKIHGYVTAAVNWLGVRVKSLFSKKKKG